MTGFLIDLDGVIYQNNQLIEGADKTVSWLQKLAIPYLFVTNTTSKPQAAILEKLRAMGIPVQKQALLTPPIAAAQYLSPNARVALFVPDTTAIDFADLTIVQKGAVDAIILGDLGNSWDFAKLNQAFTFLMENPTSQFIALGMTRYWRGPQGLQLDVGPFVSALAYATGREPVVMGKPATTFFKQALANLGESDAYMIGDDAQSDIGGAQAAGLKAIQVKTGKFTARDLESSQPDRLLDSFADLPKIWPDLA